MPPNLSTTATQLSAQKSNGRSSIANMEIASPGCCRTVASHWQAVGVMQLVAAHAQLTVTTGTRGLSALVDSFRPEGHFLEEALIDDNANLEIIIKISSSGAQNRRVGFAIATLLEAKLSAAQNGAIHGPLSYLPPPLASGRFGVDANRLRRHSSSFFRARRDSAPLPASTRCPPHWHPRKSTKNNPPMPPPSFASHIQPP